MDVMTAAPTKPRPRARPRRPPAGGRHPPARWLAARWLALATIAVAAAACGGDDTATAVPDGTTVVVANSPGTITTDGPQRVLIALLGDGPNDFVGGDDLPATFGFRSLDDGGELDQVEGRWLSTAGVSLGLYIAGYDFDAPGLWEVAVVDGGNVPAALVEVVDDSSVPAPGEPAPRSDSPTAASVDEVAAISTDPEPDLDFYRLSVADAVTNGRPTMVVFASPAFCQTAVCGPTMDIAKRAVADHPNVDVVHVEPYDIEQARAGRLQPVALMTEWGIVTEPWVFIVDGDGVISASFEGIVGEAELEQALAGL
ncbi:MAG: thioredoxin family protein [Acidimicrobiales bacterium]